MITRLTVVHRRRAVTASELRREDDPIDWIERARGAAYVADVLEETGGAALAALARRAQESFPALVLLPSGAALDRRALNLPVPTVVLLLDPNGHGPEAFGALADLRTWAEQIIPTVPPTPADYEALSLPHQAVRRTLMVLAPDMRAPRWTEALKAGRISPRRAPVTA